MSREEGQLRFQKRIRQRREKKGQETRKKQKQNRGKISYVKVSKVRKKVKHFSTFSEINSD